MIKTKAVMTSDDISAMAGRDAVATLTGPERSFLVYRINGKGHLLVQVTFMTLDTKRWTLMFEGSSEAQTYTAAIQYGAVVVGRDIARLWGGEPPHTNGARSETYSDFN